MNLANIDLNLLLAFDALMQEQHVSRAGVRIGLSQPAMSSALKRLRSIFDDPLLVRTPHGMAPTQRAQDLRLLIEPALTLIGRAVDGRRDFDAASASRHFTIAMADGVAFELMPLLLPVLRAEAPNIELTIIDAWAHQAFEGIMAGAIDLAISVIDERPLPDLVFEPAWRLSHSCVGDASNPVVASGQVSAEALVASPHVLVTQGDHGTPMEAIFASMGYRLRAVLRVPHFYVAARAVKNTDLVTIIPKTAVASLADCDAYAVAALPFDLPTPVVTMVWNRRHQSDPGHEWLRSTIKRAAGRLNQGNSLDGEASRLQTGL